MRPTVSIVVPVYNGGETLRPLTERLTAVLDSWGTPYEIILVDDGSRDDSPGIARLLQSEYPAVRSLRLLRNYGQHNAILCGLRHARHAVVVTLDDDLQHPPEEIPRLLETLGDRYDVVYGTAVQEQHGFFRDLASQFTKLVMQQVLDVESARQVSGFRAFRLVLRGALDDFNGPYVNIDVMLTWATTRIAGVAVRHEPRRVGRSNYTLRWLMRHALNMLTGFSVLPLRISSVLGFVLTLFGVGALAFVLGRYLLFGVVVPGFSFLASIIIVFSGTQLFALGVMGEYLARMHFRLLGRPTYALRTEGEEPGRDEAP
jgi:undecaprenyl-phosphate 4-deoxy-4-formamido-L-arabinose transferase